MDATPWSEVADLLDYWEECPPLHLMVKSYLGIEPPEEHKEMSPQEMQAWVSQFQG